MCADIAASLNINTASFGTVTEFLQSAGQGSIVSQVCINGENYKMIYKCTCLPIVKAQACLYRHHGFYVSFFRYGKI